MVGVKFERKTSNLSLDTSDTAYFKSIFKEIQKTIDPGCRIVDPFARNCKLEGYDHQTNDLDESTKAEYHLDAKDFMRLQDRDTADLVIFDPPFSPHQAERYTRGMKNIYTNAGYINELMIEIDRVLKPGAYILKFGFNSTRHRGHWELVKVWIVNHGGNHNDTIVTLWRNMTHTLGEFLL